MYMWSCETNWSLNNKDIPTYSVGIEKWNEKINELNCDPTYKLSQSFYWIQHFSDYNYQVLKRSTGLLLTFTTKDGDKVRYWYGFNNQPLTNYDIDLLQNNGKEAFDFIANKFRNLNKLTISKAFVDLDKDLNLHNELKKCVPTPIKYATNFMMNKELSNCYKADVSSCYPSQLCKDLPTLKDYKRLDGRIEPTEEYPFAFYLNSHHIKIYNELDTKKDFDTIYYDRYYDNVYNDYIDDEITILCKRSSYSFKEIFEELYNIKNNSLKKEEISKYKSIMNSFIGYLHKNSNPDCAHIAAVVIARANKFIIDNCHKLTSEGNKICNICTDSIGWQGKESSLATNNKYLGSFTYEYKDVKMYIYSNSSYQILSDNKVITKCPGIRLDDNRRNIWMGLKGTKEVTEKLLDDHIYINDDWTIVILEEDYND